VVLVLPQGQPLPEKAEYLTWRISKQVLTCKLRYHPSSVK
jgi:hypothetical protein